MSARAPAATPAPRNRHAHETPSLLELLLRSGVLDPEEAGLRRRFALRLLLVGALFFGQVWVSMEARRLGYQAAALGRVIDHLDKERVEVEEAVARESRATLLITRARELGMQKPGPGQLRRLDAKP